MLGGGGGTISWLPRVQKVTATASSESEYVALAKLLMSFVSFDR